METKCGMAFHPQKCGVLSISRSRFPIRVTYSLKGHILTVHDSTKYLGVDRQSFLSWKLHIDRTTKKANSMLGFLRRNLRSCSEDTKANAYFSMIRSTLEYSLSYGILNIKNNYGRLRWYKEELHVTLPTDLGTSAAYHQ